MSCGCSGGLMLVRPWPYGADPPWPWRMVDFGFPGAVDEKAVGHGGISSWIVFLVIMFMVLWSGFK
ncbi:MAG: hypothetical protein HPY50_06845 [Firmicutes bacterium]|nr:hypothetical protein [Bacillota bacterium]